MIKFANFEFIFANKGLKLVGIGEKIQNLCGIKYGAFFSFILEF